MGLILRLGPKQKEVASKRKDWSHQTAVCNFPTCLPDLYRQKVNLQV